LVGAFLRDAALDWAMLEVLAFWLSIMAVIVVFTPSGHSRPSCSSVPRMGHGGGAAKSRLLQLNGARGPTLSRQCLEVEVG
jgi:hypothetical protein